VSFEGFSIYLKRQAWEWVHAVVEQTGRHFEKIVVGFTGQHRVHAKQPQSTYKALCTPLVCLIHSRVDGLSVFFILKKEER